MKTKSISVYKNMAMEPLLQLLQAGLHEGVYAVEEVVANFPKAAVPVHDVYEGPLYFVLWKGKVMAAVRNKYYPDVEEIALDYCFNTGNPFVRLEAADPFSKDGYYRAPSGKTVTKEHLSIVPWHAATNISPFPQVKLRYHQTSEEVTNHEEEDHSDEEQEASPSASE